MATGDSNDIVQRVKQLIPGRWFAWVAPYRDAILGGLADGAASGYSFYLYAKQQSRIATASGIWLDLIGWDFFGSRFMRRFGESDTSWRPRILKEILRPRQTRAAISGMLVDLTTKTPKLLEFWNPQDCGGYGVAKMGGYGTGPGCYGSLQYNNSVFITAYRSPSQGIPNVDGYGGYAGGYGVGSIEYGSSAFVAGPLTDAEIYARIAQTIAAGTTAWVALSDSPSVAPSVIFTTAGRDVTFELLGF